MLNKTKHLEAAIKQLESRLSEVATENGRLLLEVNGLKNLVRSLPECRETSKARELVGLRRWEDKLELESDIKPSKDPLYATKAEEVDLTNEARERKYQARANRTNAGLTNVHPIELG